MTEFRVELERAPGWSDGEIKRRVSLAFARILALEPAGREQQRDQNQGKDQGPAAGRV